jgi:hypothetical protein
MVATLLRLVGFDLQRRIENLKLQAEEVKLRAVDEAKRQVTGAAITIGIAFVGLMLGLLAVVIGLVSLYLRVAMVHGPFVGLAVVGCITAVLAAVMFGVAVKRSSPAPSIRPLGDAAGGAMTSTGSPAGAATSARETAAVSDDALNLAVETIRSGPREALLATLAIAVVIGIVVGRRR